MLSLVNSLDRSAVSPGSFRFITLTYPMNYPTAKASKRHLDVFMKRFRRRYGRRGGIWKLEPQRRGAPHYHLLVLMQTVACIQDEIEWAAHAWNEIAGNEDPAHLRVHLGLASGSRPCVEVVRDWEGVGRYAGKYLAKVNPFAPEWKNPGNFWGKFCPELLPLRRRQVNLSVEAAALVRRAVVSWFNRQQPQAFYVPGRVIDGRFQHGKTIRANYRFENMGGKSMREVWRSIAGARAKRFKWRRSRGGVSAFMPSHVFERIVHWAIASLTARSDPLLADVHLRREIRDCPF
jgi:hypothetical protein